MRNPIVGSPVRLQRLPSRSGRCLEPPRELGWQTLQERGEAASLTLFYKIVNKLVAVDTGNLLRASIRNTRSNSSLSSAFINIQTTKDCYKYSFFSRTISDCNKLSPRTREAKSVDAFKALLCVPSAHRLDQLPAHSLLKPYTSYPLWSLCALIIRILFIYLFIWNSADTFKKKYSEHKIVGLKISKHAAWHCRDLNLIKSRLLYATVWRHLNNN